MSLWSFHHFDLFSSEFIRCFSFLLLCLPFWVAFLSSPVSVSLILPQSYLSDFTSLLTDLTAFFSRQLVMRALLETSQLHKEETWIPNKESPGITSLPLKFRNLMMNCIGCLQAIVMPKNDNVWKEGFISFHLISSHLISFIHSFVHSAIAPSFLVTASLRRSLFHNRPPLLSLRFVSFSSALLPFSFFLSFSGF